LLQFADTATVHPFPKQREAPNCAPNFEMISVSYQIFLQNELRT
jgi:hypothetical protein